MENLSLKAAENLDAVRKNKPLIHNITNFVVMNYTANALLAMGASPVMAHAPNEVEHMVSFAGALVLNIGTLTDGWIDSMIIAGKKATALKTPIILDPVGSGATLLRTESAKNIINKTHISVIRGNASEILSLKNKDSKTKGVDSIHSVKDAADTAKILAKELKTTLAITGSVDRVTDGERTVHISNGHPLMSCVTGTGCTATVTIELHDENAKYPLGWAMLDDPKIKRETKAGFDTLCEWMDVNRIDVAELEDQLAQLNKKKRYRLKFEEIKQVKKEKVRIPRTARSRRTRRSRRRSRTRTKTTVTKIPATVHLMDFAKLFNSSLVDTETLARPTIASDDRKESALRYIGLWGSNKVNVNSAPRQVLEAAFVFGGDADRIAQEIIERRRIKPFEDVNDLKRSLFQYSDCRCAQQRVSFQE